MRTDSVAGTSGTSSTSAAVKTLSDTSEIEGGQSRIATSYCSAQRVEHAGETPSNGRLRLVEAMSRFR